MNGLDSGIKYAAQLSNVREVSLNGSADTAFWKELLRKDGLMPMERDGQAQVMICGADSRFWGIRFRELSVSVFARRIADGREGAYLAQAFNSLKFFAFVERRRFATPYYFGKVQVDFRIPASLQVTRAGGITFRAAMAADATKREPARSGEDGWEGPLFLPGATGKWFYAKLTGHTLAYPFARNDSVTLKPTPRDWAFHWLSESNFRGREWLIREDARHAKSKSYSEI